MGVTRLMDRDMPMHQSMGKFNIQKSGVSRQLLYANHFHLLLHLPTWQLITLCMLVYVGAWTSFAAWWLHISEPCQISIETYRQALYLSMETMMTIGYGVDDPFFNDCSEAMPLLFFQSFAGILLDIAIVGVVFQRISRAYKRASTLIFSNNVLLRVRGGKVQFAFQVAEMSKEPLLQVTLQAYCVIHRLDITNETYDQVDASEPFEEVVMKALHLQELDVTNNVLLCGLPMTVTHTIDRHSPLAPCNHPSQTSLCDPTIDEVKSHLSELPYVEILIILSGVEEITGASVEGRQSYTIEEIIWGREFVRCVSVDEDGNHTVDFKHFHHTRKSSANLQSPSRNLQTTGFVPGGSSWNA